MKGVASTGARIRTSAGVLAAFVPTVGVGDNSTLQRFTPNARIVGCNLKLSGQSNGFSIVLVQAEEIPNNRAKDCFRQELPQASGGLRLLPNDIAQVGRRAGNDLENSFCY